MEVDIDSTPCVVSDNEKELIEGFLSRCKERNACKPDTEAPSMMKPPGQIGWRSRRQVLNKLIELHEENDDIDVYGFPRSGPFSILAMKMRYPYIFTAVVGNESDISIGNSESPFGNELYGEIGVGNDLLTPFEQSSGLVSKLAWGLLNRESYTEHLSTNNHDPKKDDLDLVNKKEDSDDDICDEQSFAFEDLIEKVDHKQIDSETASCQEAAFDRTQEIIHQATGLARGATTEVKRSQVAAKIRDTDDAQEKRQLNTERLQRLNRKMDRRVPEGVDPNEDVINPNTIMKLNYFAEEVYRMFIAGLDEYAEDELQDVLKRNVKGIKTMITQDSNDFESQRLEDIYFNSD
eukprot:GHVH01005526.1.p1 GENE.GHVH01005526.1~~GHVH01005526.1.p1  ORF type:complete len:349 (+),score=62.11 GHVH01005526.1:413-1459(+)